MESRNLIVSATQNSESNRTNIISIGIDVLEQPLDVLRGALIERQDDQLTATPTILLVQLLVQLRLVHAEAARRSVHLGTTAQQACN